jgi:threonyl-tRNA synthetase
MRVEVDDRREKIGYKIREAQLERPYMLVIGDKEMEAGTVAVRSRRDGDKGALPVGSLSPAEKRGLGQGQFLTFFLFIAITISAGIRKGPAV